ncbi:MAG: carbohydrate ABC transporter permease [Saccharofermentanales bacterium]
MISIRSIRRKIRRITPGRVFLYLIVTLLVGFTSLPLVYMATTAFKPLNELLAFPPQFFVRSATIQNFYDLFIALGSSEIPFLRYVLNSAFISVVTVAGTVIVSSLGAFGVVKLKPKGARIVFNVIIAALMFSPYVIQIPGYLIVNRLGLMNSYLALILPKIAIAYNYFLMDRFMGEIPDALLESAKIDGAKDISVYWRIVMPLLKPAWATLVVFSFISVWNDYFSSLIYITDPALKTLPLAMQLISGGSGVADIARAGASAASTLLITLPTIILFVIMQAKVMKTMAHSGIKL